MVNNIKKFSYLLSYVLRHNPGKLKLDMDSNGWVKVDQLLNNLPNNNKLSFDELEEIVLTNNKQRYSFNDDKTLIRANQGHSIDVNLELKPLRPPFILYHGTKFDLLNKIQKEGLIKMNRQHVHLSEDRETALKVGKRRKGVVGLLSIKATMMEFDGYKFYKSKNGVWLTDHVPSKYIEIIL